jgi:amidophosphoribosyltransferase
MSIIKMLDRLGPKQIVIVSSAPQIRYPDCYGIDMAKLEDFVAFRAALALHKDQNTYEEVVQAVYKKCKSQDELSKTAVDNYVKAIYEPFSDEQISDKIAELLSDETTRAKVKVIYQSVDNLHQACPDHKGDWYFTGDYPTIGGSKIVNKAFINFVEGNKKRAY